MKLQMAPQVKHTPSHDVSLSSNCFCSQFISIGLSNLGNEAPQVAPKKCMVPVSTQLNEVMPEIEFHVLATGLQNDPDKEVQTKVATNKIEMNRKSAEASNANGNEGMDLQNYYMAERHYAEAIALWPNNLSFHGNRCVSLIKQGKLKRALDDCQQIIEIDPNYAMGHEYQAKCYQIYGDYDGAYQVAINLETIASQSSNRIKDLNVELRKHQRFAIQCFDDRDILSAGKHTK